MQAIANDSNRGGEVSKTANPAISELLATYLADEKARLAAKIHGLYADVIERLQHNLNGYAANSPDKDECELWEELFDAVGGRHREFCEIFGPWHILPHIGEFLSCLTVSKAMAGQDLLRVSGKPTALFHTHLQRPKPNIRNGPGTGCGQVIRCTDEFDSSPYFLSPVQPLRNASSQ